MKPIKINLILGSFIFISNSALSANFGEFSSNLQNNSEAFVRSTCVGFVTAKENGELP